MPRVWGDNALLLARRKCPARGEVRRRLVLRVDNAQQEELILARTKNLGTPNNTRNNTRRGNEQFVAVGPGACNKKCVTIW